MADFAEQTSTPEERLQIAQHYLLSSPPGQFHEVLTDVRKLVTDGILTEALETGIARVYNTKNGKVVTAPSGSKVVIATAGEVDATHYVDPNNGSIFTIDHLTLTTSEDPIPSNQDGSLELLRAALQAAVNKYVEEKFSTETAAGSVFAKAGQISVCITGERPNLRNFWSGKWNSTWTLVKAASGSSLTVTGEIKVHAHYFEDGNVQLQSAKPVASVEIAMGGSEAEAADAVVKHIRASEGALQDALGEMYGSMNEETFRSMRRVLPVTRTKMEWNVNAVRMVSQLTGPAASKK